MKNKYKRFVILLYVITITKGYSQSASFYHQKFKSVTFGSNQYDEGKQIMRTGKNVYIFGNTRTTTINNDVTNVYGLGDIFIEKYDSVGSVSYKMIGGGGYDNLLKVEQDTFGFWLYIQSQSGIGGSRTKPLTCYPTYGFNPPYMSDLWIVRLDNHLNQVADYSMCFDFLHVNVTETYVRAIELNKRTNIIKMVVAGKDSLSTEFTNYLLQTDTIGYIIDKMYLGRQEKTTSGNIGGGNFTVKSRFNINKILTQSDSITLILQDYDYRLVPAIGLTDTKVVYSSGCLKRVNTTTKKYKDIIIKMTKSDNRLKTLIHHNGKLHIYSNSIPVVLSGRNLDSLYLSTYPIRYNRTAAARTNLNKSDLWCLVLDSASLNYSSEYAIGSSDSTLISNVFKYNNKIHLMLSSKGIISFDKAFNSKGGYDYWLLNLTNSNTVDKQILFGGPKDDILYDVNIDNGSMFLTGTSKSSIGSDKFDASRDGNIYGDSWTQSTCYKPIINYTTNATQFPNGSLLTINNTSQNAINFKWTFNDKTGSIIESTERNPSSYLYNADTLLIMVTATNYVCNHFVSSSVLVEPYYVGINEIDKEEYIIFPNPFTDYIYIKSKYGSVYEYELLNVLGQLLIKGVTDNNGEIITNGINPGSYTLKIKQKDKTINYKLIKQ